MDTADHAHYLKGYIFIPIDTAFHLAIENLVDPLQLFLALKDLIPLPKYTKIQEFCSIRLIL